MYLNVECTRILNNVIVFPTYVVKTIREQILTSPDIHKRKYESKYSHVVTMIDNSAGHVYTIWCIFVW